MADPSVLAPVQALYASADYEGALSMLNRVADTGAASDAADVTRYRVLCLVALDRADEAAAAIEQLFRKHPFYEPSIDVPPRVRAMFDAVHLRVLPELVRTRYANGKSAFDRKDFDTALTTFEQALHLIDQIDEEGPIDPELADLRTLADGFLSLSRQFTVPVPAGAASVAAEPIESRPASAQNASPAASHAPAAASGAMARPSDPIVIRQDLPAWLPPAANNVLFQGEFRGAIEVEINEQGAVASAIVIEPIHPLYDTQLLRASRDWKYQPAHLEGQPVSVRKRIDVVLRSP